MSGWRQSACFESLVWLPHAVSRSARARRRPLHRPRQRRKEYPWRPYRRLPVQRPRDGNEQGSDSQSVRVPRVRGGKNEKRSILD